ncbi:MAG: methyltransferase domain-containing protein [Desulfurococcales archaeon]|nr:methyltransferase domain-containing protein [Desulfurococcales archaeon]
MTLGGNPLVPFVPTRNEVLPVVFKLLNLNDGDIFYDLGCGDGRVVVEAAKRFPVRKAVCIELRRELAEEARRRAKREGVDNRVYVVEADFFKVNLSEATAIYMYLLTSVNEALKPKLKRELRPGTRIVTLDFPIPGWEPVKTMQTEGAWQKTLYLYVIGKSDKI